MIITGATVILCNWKLHCCYYESIFCISAWRFNHNGAGNTYWIPTWRFNCHGSWLGIWQLLWNVRRVFGWSFIWWIGCIDYWHLVKTFSCIINGNFTWVYICNVSWQSTWVPNWISKSCMCASKLGWLHTWDIAWIVAGHASWVEICIWGGHVFFCRRLVYWRMDCSCHKYNFGRAGICSGPLLLDILYHLRWIQ